jgi:hypothetical protein
MFSAPSNDDFLELYQMQSFGIGQDFLDDRTLISPRLNPAERTGIIVTIGQSLICNSVQYPFGVYSPTNGAKVQNFNFITGGVYTAKDDLLGCHGQGANIAVWLGDALINNNIYDRVILAPIGFSSTGSGQWAVGGDMNHRIPVLARRLSQKGYVPNFVLWQQGTADAAAGTAQAVTQANIQSMIDTFRANGIICPILISKESYQSPAIPSVTATRAAQAAVVNPAAKVYAGADADTLDATKRFDGLHFNYAGAAAWASLELTAIQAVPP